MTLLEAMADPNLFAAWFRDVQTWRAWRVFLAALFGLGMAGDELELFSAHTGRAVAPTTPASEAWLICGRRAGKSFVLALVAVYLACFRNYRAYLAPGERATILVIAADRRQARTIMRYCRALLMDVPLVAAMVEREVADGFDLTNGVTIEVATASYRTTRGYALVGALCDELAFWRTDDSAEPDYAVLDALRPGMATIPGAMLLCASSPYARRGALWDAYRRHYGQDGRVLVWQAATRAMNPCVPQHVVDAAVERDPASAAAEWLAQFRTDVERFLTREAVEAVVSRGVLERAPLPDTAYVGFVDPSGGSSDSMTLAVGHREGTTAIIDAIRERRPPFQPEACVAEFADTLRRYRVHAVRGDRYAGEWPRDAFRRHGVEYLPATKVKSDLYLELLPHVNSGEIDLLDNAKLVNELLGLERRTARGGKDSIDHAPGAHDDIANVVAGVSGLLHEQRQSIASVFPIVFSQPCSLPGYDGSDSSRVPGIFYADDYLH